VFLVFLVFLPPLAKIGVKVPSILGVLLKMKWQLQLAFTSILLLFTAAFAGPQEPDTGRNFVYQLQRVFGRFNNADLHRVFDSASPLLCSELAGGTGEWREVAFFNEYRQFGDWYRTSLEEVKADLAVYVFNGPCTGQMSPVQVTTRFPVEESLQAYRDGKIRFREIDVKNNAPVSARFDMSTGAYRFDLPYLFRVSDGDQTHLYTLSARRLLDRYAAEVTNRWECKSIADADVTYNFLICRTTVVLHDGSAGSPPPYGTVAFSILSDGKEASAAVTLTFGTSTDPKGRQGQPASPQPSGLSFQDSHNPPKQK
jgi:hypothetical protein